MPTLITFLMTLPVVAFPLAAAHAVAKRSHLIQHPVHFGHNLHAAHVDMRAAGSA